MKKMKWAAIVIATIILATLFVRFQTFGLHSAGEASPVRVACVGDSITASTEYPSDLQSLLGPGYVVGNFGVNGSTVLLDSWKPYMDSLNFEKPWVSNQT